jgi:hypothetical protein
MKKHTHSPDAYSCTHPDCRAQRLVSTSVDDLRSSLSSYRGIDDLLILQIALRKVQIRKEKTKAKLIEASINRSKKEMRQGHHG